jgi:hypothetical protein
MRVIRDFGTLLAPVAIGALVASGDGQSQASRTDADTTTGGEEVGSESERYRAVLVPESLTWEEAKRLAEADGGHLVSITSAQENALVLDLIAENPGIWVNVDINVMS